MSKASAFCYFIATSSEPSAISVEFTALGKELARRGHRVLLLTHGAHKYEIEDRQNNPSVWAWPSPRPTRFEDAVFLWRLISQYKPDCVVSNFGAVNLMTLVGWLKKIPVRIAWYHTMSHGIRLDNYQSKYRLRLLRLRKRFIYGLTTHVVANSKAAAEDAHMIYSVGQKKLYTFPNSISDPFANRDSVNIARNTKKVICVGRFDKSKGQDVLIKAFSRLKQSYVNDITLFFIGSGPLKDAYIKLASELSIEKQCFFLGFLPHHEVLKEMASAAVSVVPSRHEAFGLVNVESLSVGTPVIASRVGGIPDIIRDGIDGFLIPPDDPDALSEKILQIFTNESLRCSMSENARNRFLDQYELSKVLQKKADWFEEIIPVKKDNLI